MFHHRRVGESWVGAGPLLGPIFGRAHHGRDQDEAAWSWPAFGAFGRYRRSGRGSDRLFDRGDLKYVILDLLRERPRHGYDIIRALEQRFRGLYSPSPGSIYPTLQLLEDQGYVSSNQQDGKKVYTLTDEGREFLAERAATLNGIRARMEAGRGGGTHAELHALMGEFRDLAGTVFRQASRGAFADPDRVRRLRAVVARARGEIDAVLSNEADPPSTVL